MIEYDTTPYGLNFLWRMHGSAVYKSWIPGLLSVLILWIYRFVYRPVNSDDDLEHPYTIGVLVSSISFIIIFRANNAYQRYWEGAGNVYQFMSKILDGTVHTASYHMQCAHYDKIKPPSFHDRPDLLHSGLSRDRERRGHGKEGTNRLTGPGRDDGGWGLLFDSPQPKKKADFHSTKSFVSPPRDQSWSEGKNPSPFLQELAHLSSLSIAVAFSTLRDDMEGTESALGVYTPGSEWPAADPDKLPGANSLGCPHHARYWIGMERSEKVRTQNNAARPMLVLGGVSENERVALSRARGASAKTNLAWLWLSEFIIREHLAGCTGNVGAPMLSRVMQFLSDGMIFYNHGRKIMYIPFPFPHAQISVIFIFTLVIAVPFLMEQYTDDFIVGALLTFSTVSGFTGLHEVARELENPYINIPNEIPLCTLLAQYNESLITMCTGYHPDSYWVVEGEEPSRNEVPSFPRRNLKSNSSKVKKLKEKVVNQKKTIQDLTNTIEELKRTQQDWKVVKKFS